MLQSRTDARLAGRLYDWLTTIAVPLQIAYMISGMIYFMWSLHCGFIIPSPSYPGWWIWL